MCVHPHARAGRHARKHLSARACGVRTSACAIVQDLDRTGIMGWGGAGRGSEGGYRRSGAGRGSVGRK